MVDRLNGQWDQWSIGSMVDILDGRYAQWLIGLIVDRSNSERLSGFCDGQTDICNCRVAFMTEKCRNYLMCQCIFWIDPFYVSFSTLRETQIWIIDAVFTLLYLHDHFDSCFSMKTAYFHYYQLKNLNHSSNSLLKIALEFVTERILEILAIDTHIFNVSKVTNWNEWRDTCTIHVINYMHWMVNNFVQ